MNILFFGKNSFVAQYLINDLKRKNNIFFFSRKTAKKKDFSLNLSKKKPISKKFPKISNGYAFIFSSFVPLNEINSEWRKCKLINIDGIINLLKQLKIPLKKNDVINLELKKENWLETKKKFKKKYLD